MNACRVKALRLAVPVLFAAISTTWAAGGEPTRPTTPSKEKAVAPSKEPPSFAKGVQAQRAGKLDEAIAALEQATKEAPGFAPSYQYLARIHYDQKRYADSIKMGKQATKLDPRVGRAWRTLGLAQMANDDTKSAAESFAKAAEIEPKNFWTLNNLGYALFLLDRNDEARKALERAVAIDSKQAMTWNTLGVARMRTKDRAGAIEAFKKALQMDPSYARAKANRVAAEGQSASKAP